MRRRGAPFPGPRPVSRAPPPGREAGPLGGGAGAPRAAVWLAEAAELRLLRREAPSRGHLHARTRPEASREELGVCSFHIRAISVCEVPSFKPEAVFPAAEDSACAALRKGKYLIRQAELFSF